jgi:hypothetical protein
MGKRNTGAGAAPAQNTALAEMTKEQLIDMAVEKGVDLDGDMDKEEIIQALIKADPSLSKSDESGNGDNDSQNDESEAPDPEIKVGTIRTIQGVEMVKINDSADGWVPTVRENIEAGKPVTIVCPKRAGRTIYAKSGKPITLDASGRAIVSAVDGYYLQNIVINGKPEYTVE